MSNKLMFQIENETNLIISFNQDKLSFNTNENSEISNEDIVKFLINLSEEIHSDNISIEDKKNENEISNDFNMKEIYLFFYDLFFNFIENFKKNYKNEKNKLDSNLNNTENKIKDLIQ